MSHLDPTERRHAADQFSRSVSGDVSQTKNLIRTGAIALIVKHAKVVLDPATYEEAKRCLDNDRLEALFQVLRRNATHFVAKGLSTAYWCWIDAFSFMEDAIGVRWPYMTDSGRRSSLKHAQDCAQEALEALA